MRLLWTVCSGERFQRGEGAQLIGAKRENFEEKKNKKTQKAQHLEYSLRSFQPASVLGKMALGFPAMCSLFLGVWKQDAGRRQLSSGQGRGRPGHRWVESLGVALCWRCLLGVSSWHFGVMFLVTTIASICQMRITCLAL